VEPMRLNLGAGEHMAPKPWINVDVVQRAPVIDRWFLRADVMELPVRAYSAKRIYAGHLIEHMTPTEAALAIRHWIGKLTMGGELGVVVPDIQRMWKLYVKGGFSRDDMGGAIGGERDVNDPYALHLTVWSANQLTDFMERVTGLEVEPLVLAEWPAVSEADWQVGAVVRRGVRREGRES
jgi:predicted SAM-dependent methyltransferase